MKILAITVFAITAATANAQYVPAGSALIEKALIQLVPAPLQATIDYRIPEATVLKWDASVDWMVALQQATSQAGLQLKPNFEAGQINVMPGRPNPKALKSTETSSELPKVTSHPALQTKVEQGAAATIVDEPEFLIMPGIRIDQQLSDWAKKSGWTLIWSSEKSWIPPGASPIKYTGPVDVATERAVNHLYSNGLPVRLEIWEANKIMEISHAKK
ncbi:TcpQ domain-containing protein [Delftia sp. GW456-R20]|uniref:TcpQ domain-containing protein n=1 Tax=Delftia sp. GW456-R20 TaxID=1827145 RepID=UPI0009EF0E5C|nr:TcpQ domain-containing protein [Delftia sp. GW456-R20]